MERTSVPERRRRAVIVYERAGQGHLAAAELLRSILQADPDVEVILKDGEELESDAPGNNPFVALWNLLIRRGWFRLADFLLNHCFRVAIFPILVVTAGSRVKIRLKEMLPDAVITTADVFSLALGDAANELGVPFTVFPIEFSIFADLLHKDAEYICYFEETARAIRRFDLGSPHFRFTVDDRAPLRERLRYLAAWFGTYGLLRTEPLLYQRAGNPAPATNNLPCHIIGPLREPEDHAPAGAPPVDKRPQVLVASGSLGGHFVSSTARRLLAVPGLQVDVVAICGRDEVTLKALQSLLIEAGGSRLECCGHVSDMAARLRRASVLLARPTASLFLESILAGVPLLIPAWATKNDAGTVDLIRAWQIGETYDRADEVPSKLAGMLRNLPAYRDRLRALRSRFPEPRDSVAARIRAVVWRPFKTP